MHRLARRFGLDRNPLRRRTDRVEAWLRLSLACAVVLFGPVLIGWAGTAAYRSVLAATDHERGRLYEVDAVLLEDAVGLAYVRGEEAGWPVPARARWTAPNGDQRTGDVVTDTAAAAGTVIVIWTDVHGDIVDTKHGRTPAGAAVGAGLAVGLAIAAVYSSLLLVIRRTLHRRRMASWQLEWTVFEPRWSGRRSHGTAEGTEV
jgi:hypothetical protein